MTTTNDNSSLPLLLSISGAVLLVAVGGWFVLEPETAHTPVVSEITAGAEQPVPEEATEESGTVEGPSEQVPTDIEAQLRKARLAAAAEILILPADQSALHYYRSVLDADPQHAVANAELDALLAGVAQIVSEYLAASRYEEAHEIATLVSRVRPEHSLVTETRLALDSAREQIIQDAIQQAQDGNDEEATLVLATVQDLPDHQPGYLTAVRDSIAEIKRVRLAAEQDKRQRAQLAAAEARAAWVNRVENAIAAGNLIAPAGASAKDLLAEPNSWRSERTRLTGNLISALLAACQADIDAGRLASAEKLLASATELSGDGGSFEELRLTLENAFIEAESGRVLRMEQLVALKTVPPKYPRRAEQRGLSGWVVVEFTIDASGETTNIRVTDAEPESVFNESVIEAVEQWQFEPREFRGQLISQRATTRLGFRLAD